MNNNLIKYILFFSLSIFFGACSDNENEGGSVNKDNTTAIAGAYKGSLLTNLSVAEATNTTKITIERINDKEINLLLSKLIVNEIEFDNVELSNITISVNKEGNIYVLSKKSEGLNLQSDKQKITVTSEGTVKDGTLILNLEITTEEISTPAKMHFEGQRMTGNESSEAVMTDISFNSRYVLKQPIIENDNRNLVVYIDNNATVMNLFQVPVSIKTSNGAEVSPASGSTVDLSKEAIKFIVLAEDGLTKTEYTLEIKKVNIFVMDMEEWVGVYFEGGGDEAWYNSPQQMSNNNPMGIIFANTPMISQSDDAIKGRLAAKIETLKNNSGVANQPAIMAGTLFTGIYRFDAENLQKSNRYGPIIISPTKPLTLSGYYKYTSGKQYYECSDIKTPDKTSIVDKKDECVISAVLYEYNKGSNYLTDEDLYTSERIVAIAKFVSKDQAEYAHFEVNFEYTKELDPKKKYYFTIVATSSKEGGRFSGAVGSTLLVDEIAITY